MTLVTPSETTHDIGRIFAAIGDDLKSWAEAEGYSFHLSINTLHAFSHLDAAGGKAVITLHVTGAQQAGANGPPNIQTSVYQVNFRVMVMTNIGFDAGRAKSLYLSDTGTPLFAVLAWLRARILSYRLDTDLVHKGIIMGGTLTELRELAESPFYGYALDFFIRCTWPEAEDTVEITIPSDEEEEPAP